MSLSEERQHLSNSELSELLKITAFSESEIKESFVMFMRDFPDGRLKLADYIKSYRSLSSPQTNPDEYIKKLFRVQDTDGNGTIDFKESMFALSVHTRGSQEDKLRWFFKMFDSNNDGYVTFDEMASMFGAMYKAADKEFVQKMYCGLKPQQRAHAVFEQMDWNHDKTINYEDFAKAALKDSMLLLMQKTAP